MWRRKAQTRWLLIHFLPLPGAINNVQKIQYQIYVYSQDAFYEGDSTKDMFIVCCKTTMYFFFLSKKGELKGLMVWPACSLAKHCSHPLFRPLWCEIFYVNVIHQEGLICPRASAGAHFLTPWDLFPPYLWFCGWDSLPVQFWRGNTFPFFFPWVWFFFAFICFHQCKILKGSNWFSFSKHERSVFQTSVFQGGISVINMSKN